MIERSFLENEYVKKRHSAREIANSLKCSENKVTYWLQKHGIKKRSLSNALYAKHNPAGDPFNFKRPSSPDKWFLYGLGLGLYWGEGNKANKHSVRLGNTDPYVIKKFIEFLDDIYDIDRARLRFGLQLFSDIDSDEALKYWCKALNVKKDAFQKVVVTKSVSDGTYRKKCEYGVLTIYFSNMKLRDSILSAIDNCKNNATVAQLVERIHGES